MASYAATTTLQTSSEERHGSSPTLLLPDDRSDTIRADSEADTMRELNVPTHPIASMQGAFAESMLEAAGSSSPTQSKLDGTNAATRRRKLLDQDLEEDTHASKWRRKPGQQYHELWKLMAQISFGIYLLLNGIAKDEEQVLSILQGHVDEVDAFLETTLEDFDLAIKDIEERLKFLKMPLENILIFDAMLEDRQFRLQIVTGNERIEHIIHRTASAMNDALKNVKQGLDATKEFAIYLAEEQEESDWREARPDMQKVYDAMKGNAEGWYKAYVSLQTKGNHLGEILVQLGSIVAEMDKRAGEVSRKTRFSITPGSIPGLPFATAARPSSPSRTVPSHQSRPSATSTTKSASKILPSDPSFITPAIQATLPAFQLVSEREKAPTPQPLPEPEPLVEPELFTLQPRTYSPVPSSSEPVPQDPPQQVSPAPEVPQAPPARKRFSLKRKAAPEKKPSNNPLSPPQRQPETILEVRSSPRVRNPPDSAYGSDTDKLATLGHNSPDYFDSKRNGSHNKPPSDYSRSIASPKPQPQKNFSGNYVPSPRSDQQHFHPVRASPHSPLQRPWTAAPTNLRSTTSMSTSMSTMSQMTTVTENGKKVKKKRSGLGWLKKAFSLSEEEKAVFEERRRAVPPIKEYAVDRRPQFLDGRRIR